jgi:hypothetical protein
MATVSSAQIITSPSPPDSVKAEFDRLAKAMWTTEVCPALVFDKDLQICTGCLAMYSDSDPSSTHPKTMGTRITDLCKQQGISTQELFFEALWNEAMRLFAHFGAVLMPRMSGVHTEAPKSKDAARDKKNTWTQARVHLLEQEVANLRLDKDRLSASNRVLKADYQVVLEKMVNESSLMHRLRLEAAMHIDALHRLLHPEGCGCPHHSRHDEQDSK